MAGAGRPAVLGSRSRALARPRRNDDVKMDRHPGGAARAAGSGTHPPLPVRTRLLPVTRLLSRSYFPVPLPPIGRSEEHTSELQSLMRISYAVFCLKKKKKTITKML